MPSRVEAIAETALQLIFHADNISAEKIKEIAADILTIADNFQKGIDQVHNFKIDIKWKQRVIGVPHAIDHFKEIFEALTHGLKANLLTIVRPFQDFATGLKLLSAPPADAGVSRIATSFTELENFISALNLLVGNVADAVRAAGEVESLFKRILDDIQHLDGVFLQQKNKRRTVTEKKSRIRIGQLHS